MSKRSQWVIWTGAFALTGCIGTDLIDGPFEDPTITITPAVTAVALNDTITFNAEYTDDVGEVVPVDIVWSSTSTIVTIDADGVATGLAVGRASIVAALPDLDLESEPAFLNVLETADGVAVVEVDPGTADVLVGDTLQLSAQPRQLDGSTIEAAVTWQSDDPSVATVSTDGLATAVGPGETSISATADGIRSAPVSFRVVSPQEGRMATLSGLGGYSVQGTATLSIGDDGSLVLELSDDFSSSRGPALEVVLSPTSRNGPDSISLGSLQRNSGRQSYAVPEGVGLMDFDWVIIHCVPFNVSFGAGELQ